MVELSFHKFARQFNPNKVAVHSWFLTFHMYSYVFVFSGNQAHDQGYQGCLIQDSEEELTCE